MGLGPIQGDEKRLLFSNDCRWKHRPPLCHLDRSAPVERSAVQRSFLGNVFSTEESWAFGPPKVMKNGSCSATTVDGGTALPFVISTGAQRSGEICGSAVLSWKCVFDRGVMGLWPTQGDEKRLLFSNNCRWRHRPPLCHLDRSAAQWRDLRSSGPFWEMCFRPRSHGPLAPPKVMKNGSCSATTVDGGTALPFVISTEAQRSGEICGSAVLSWKCVFRPRSHGPLAHPR